MKFIFTLFNYISTIFCTAKFRIKRGVRIGSNSQIEFKTRIWIKNEAQLNIGSNVTIRSNQYIYIDYSQDDLMEDGYVAISGFIPGLFSVIIDKDGNEIWNDKDSNFLLNHINEFGNISGYSNTDYPLNTGMKTNTDMKNFII